MNIEQEFEENIIQYFVNKIGLSIEEAQKTYNDIVNIKKKLEIIHHENFSLPEHRKIYYCIHKKKTIFNKEKDVKIKLYNNKYCQCGKKGIETLLGTFCPNCGFDDGYNLFEICPNCGNNNILLGTDTYHHSD